MNEDLKETIAAVVAEVTTGFRAWDQFCERHQQMPWLEKLGILILVAEEFEEEAKERGVEWDETHDYINCIEETSNQLEATDDPDWDTVFEKGRCKV